MSKNASLPVLVLSVFTLSVVACTTPEQVVRERASLSDEYYTSAWPYTDISDALARIQRSVKRITTTGIYRTFYFDEPQYTEEDLRNRAGLEEIASSTNSQTESTAGTAIVIASHRYSVALLSAEHVVSMPDTIINYMEGDDIPEDTYVESITILQNSSHLLYDLPELGPLTVLATDPSKDLALLEVSLEDFDDWNPPVLDIPKGDPRDLRWGSVAFVFGYPNGYPMITRGIVSDPDRDRNASFMLDALFNKGISGGLIVASRGEYPNFEWVGMAYSSAAERDRYIVPDPQKEHRYDRMELYDGQLFIEEKSFIKYGITRAISMVSIREFVEDNGQIMIQRGFNPNL